MWAQVSSSAPHLLKYGLSDIPIKWKYFLRVLCPVGRSVTALDIVLLKDRNLALAPRHGPEINSRASLWVPPRTAQHIQCWLTNCQNSPTYTILVNQLTSNPSSYILPRNCQVWLRSDKLQTRAVHCQLDINWQYNNNRQTAPLRMHNHNLE